MDTALSPSDIFVGEVATAGHVLDVNQIQGSPTQPMDLAGPQWAVLLLHVLLVLDATNKS